MPGSAELDGATVTVSDLQLSGISGHQGARDPQINEKGPRNEIADPGIEPGSPAWEARPQPPGHGATEAALGLYIYFNLTIYH